MLAQWIRLTALISCVSLVACKQYKVHEIKDFRLYVKSDDKELKTAIKELAAQFNQDVGGNALTVVDREDDANSQIRFVENLKDEGGTKLGLGQWITTQSEKNKFKSYGSEKEVTVIHSMQLEFDTANFVGKLQGLSDKSSNEYKHLYHLFCHEVGHGMQLDHSKDSSSVMYATIPKRYSRSIDFAKYFSYVRSYMNIDPKTHIANAH
jgi:hypothetical protein